MLVIFAMQWHWYIYILNTDIPKQCDALCDWENTSLLSRH